MSTFTFVPIVDPNSGLSAEAKRTVRSHAMKQNWRSTGTRNRRKSVHRQGESTIDIGALYNTKSENEHVTHDGFDGDDSQSHTDGNPFELNLDLLIPTSPVINFLGGLRHIGFPVQVNDAMLSAFHHFIYVFASAIYPPHSPVVVDPVKTLWLPLAISDPASFYAALSIATAHQGGLLGLESPHQALAWKSIALRTVNERLAVSPRVNDGTMIALMFLGSYDHFFGQAQDCNVHVTGLTRLIELRGGISSLKENFRLHRYATWFDAAHACATMKRPQYANCYEPGLVAERMEKLVPTTLYHEPSNISHFSDRFRKEYQDAYAIGISIDNHCSEQVDVNSYMIISMASQLFYKEEAINILSHHLIETSCEFAIMAFLGHLMFHYQKRPMTFSPLLCSAKYSIAATEGSWDVLDPMYLWTLFMIGSSCPSSEFQPWFVQLASVAIREGQYQTWRETRKVLKQILWVKNLCDRPCKDFWNTLVSSGLLN